jgi:hypothetical protein
MIFSSDSLRATSQSGSSGVAGRRSMWCAPACKSKPLLINYNHFGMAEHLTGKKTWHGYGSTSSSQKKTIIIFQESKILNLTKSIKNTYIYGIE